MLKFFFIIFFLIYFIFVIKPLIKQFYYNKKSNNNNKIFGIGLPRTGTSSLSSAIQKLGFSVWHAPPLLNDKYLHNFISNFDAITDIFTTSNINYIELHKLYPNAKFILTVRNIKSWGKSLVKYNKMNSVSRLFPGYSKMVDNEYILNNEYYQKYNQDVINYFNQQNSQNLLVLNLEDPNKMEKLSSFLNKKVDNLEYPNEREIILHFKQCLKY